MKREPVSSSNLKSIGFEPQDRVLEVEFQNGAIYQYFGVPFFVYTSLLSTASPGTYFNTFVRDEGYHYERVDVDK
ncbi:MAG: KTSC domain-containing protein [Chloroflexota bacterium]